MTVLTIIAVVLIGVVCFVAGMTVEMFMVTGELRATRDELLYTKGELLKLQRGDGAGVVKVIEINDNRAPTGSLFDPW